MTDRERPLDELRPVALAIAYRMAGSVATRLAINALCSARARRECSLGEWLPEPIITDGHEDVAGHGETADSLSLAMLVLERRLER
jgi:hypothetical protein